MKPTKNIVLFTLPPPQAFQKNKIGGNNKIGPYSYASLRLKFQISTCERAYSLRAVWPAEEVVIYNKK
jgi:hypothetical protein